MTTRRVMHAGIRGWPEEKHERMMLAQELAKAVTLRLRETGEDIHRLDRPARARNGA